MNLKCLQQDKIIPTIDRKRNRQAPTVAFQVFKVVLPRTNPRTNTTLKTAQPENGCAVIWLRAGTRSAPAAGT